MAYNYTECNRDQLYLLPPSMKEWLGEDHFAWFLLDTMGQMDLWSFHEAYRADGKGQKAHHPEILLAVLLYGYCHGERSSRQLERLCEESVPYRILAADTLPDQYIVAAGLTTEANDQKQLRPMLEAAAANVGEAGVEKKIRTGLADAGYCSEKNMTGGSADGPELLVNTTKDWKRRKALREEPPPRGRIPKRLTATERMERKLLTKRGAALYRKRAQTVEPVFGQIKDARGLDRFAGAGTPRVRASGR